MENIYTFEEIKAITKPIFEKYQIKKAYLFGSYARGEATTESDIDTMIAKKDSKITTLVNLTEFETELQEKLNKNVDVITEETYLDETVEENKYGKLETWIRPTRGLCQRKSVRLYKGTGCR